MFNRLYAELNYSLLYVTAELNFVQNVILDIM